MTDISNKALALLVGISIIVTALGILSMPHAKSPIIGAATNETFGETNITIQSTTQITLRNNTINFGSGFVNSSGNNCTLVSNQTNAQTTGSSACQGFNQPAQDTALVVENAGNAFVTLDINGSYAGPRNFLCNPNIAVQNCTFIDPQYNRSADDQEASSCTDGGAVQNLNGYNTGFSRVMNTTLQRICNAFSFSPSTNTIQVKLRILLPRDSRQGTLNDTVTFLATG